MQPVICLSHLGITVSDIDASVAFYAQLGFVRRYDDVNDEWTRVGLALGDVVLELFSRNGSPDGPVDPFYPQAFGLPKIAFTVDDLDAVYDATVAAGWPNHGPITNTPVSRFFFVFDPDGTPIQLHEFDGGQERVADLFLPQR